MIFAWLWPTDLSCLTPNSGWLNTNCVGMNHLINAGFECFKMSWVNTFWDFAKLSNMNVLSGGGAEWQVESLGLIFRGFHSFGMKTNTIQGSLRLYFRCTKEAYSKFSYIYIYIYISWYYHSTFLAIYLMEIVKRGSSQFSQISCIIQRQFTILWPFSVEAGLDHTLSSTDLQKPNNFTLWFQSLYKKEHCFLTWPPASLHFSNKDPTLQV